MRLRKSALPWVACVVGLLICVPALAFGGQQKQATTSGAFVAIDNPNRFQDVNGGAPDDNIVEVSLPNASVDFSYPTGGSSHNVVWTQAPASCVQTAAPNGIPI